MPTVPPILNHRFRLRNGTRTFLCEDVEQSHAFYLHLWEPFLSFRHNYNEDGSRAFMGPSRFPARPISDFDLVEDLGMPPLIKDLRRERTVFCGHCGVEYAITIEPSKPAEKWLESRAAQGFACDLDDHVYCPNCDSPSGSVN